MKIRKVEAEKPPTEPVVPCVECGRKFVWWLHPVQLCDPCVDRAYDAFAKHEREDVC